MFSNDSTNIAVTLRKRSDGQEFTLRPLESKSVEVSLGSVFDVITDGTETASPVFINHLMTSYPVVILPQPPYRTIDARGQHVFMGRDLATAYYGFDLRKFNSRDIVSSTGSRRIFRGLQPETSEYEILTAGYIPRGCAYGDRNRSEGEDNYEKIFTHDAFSKTWNIGVSGEIPLGTSPGSLGLDFGYGETERRTSSNNNVFIVNHKKDIRYFVNCDPLDEAGDPNFVTPLFTQDFVRGVQSVIDATSADKFVNDFGTHYPAEVNYGGHRSSWVIIEESDYYKGLEQRVDFAAEIKVAAGSQKVATVTPNTNPFDPSSSTTTTSNIQTSPGGSGGLNFNHVQNQEARDLLQRSKSFFWAAGGVGALIGAWDVPSDSAIPVSVELRRIDKLIRAELFRSPLTATDLAKRKTLITEAIARAEAQIPVIPVPEQKRGFRFRYRKITFVEDVDDLSHEMSGNIFVNLGSQHTLWSSANQGQGWTNPRPEWERPGDWIEYEQVANSDGSYPSVSLSISGSLIDNDAGTSDTCRSIAPHCDDPISFSTEQLDKHHTLDELDQMQSYHFEMKGFRTHAEKTTLSIEVQVQPMAHYGNQPERIQFQSTRSAQVVNHSVTNTLAAAKILPVEHDPRATVLDTAFYLGHYADLKAAFGSNETAARDHWLRYGLQEGRQSSVAFSIKDYVARYDDLQEAFGADYRAALDHWLTFGREEQRDPRPESIISTYRRRL